MSIRSYIGAGVVLIGATLLGSYFMNKNLERPSDPLLLSDAVRQMQFAETELVKMDRDYPQTTHAIMHQCSRVQRSLRELNQAYGIIERDNPQEMAQLYGQLNTLFGSSDEQLRDTQIEVLSYIITESMMKTSQVSLGQPIDPEQDLVDRIITVTGGLQEEFERRKAELESTQI